MEQVMVKAHFNVVKAAQAAGVLLRTNPHRRFEYMRLLKLLYIAMRECLQERRHILLLDRVVAMKHGPVLSRVYDLIVDADPNSPDWSKFFRTDGYDIELVENPGVGLLSKYEIEKLREVAERYHGQDVFSLSELTHEFPEWKTRWNIKGNRKAIDIDWATLAESLQIDADHLREAIQEAVFANASLPDSEDANRAAG